jgi:hypothetical protein
MLSAISELFQPYHSQARIRQLAFARLIWFFLILVLTGTAAFLIEGQQPDLALIAWFFYLLGAGFILYQPRYGIYLVVFFALLGDATLTPWYPFVKNFSSRESIFFLSDKLIISPLEAYIILTFVSWLLHMLGQKRVKFYSGPLFLPAFVFLFFVVFGLVYGIYRGGDTNIALWEVRPIVYLLLMLFLASNLFERREHPIKLFWFAMGALFLEGLIGSYSYLFVLKGDLSDINALTQHSVAIHINSAFIFAMGLWLYRSSKEKRLAMLIAMPGLMLTYIAAQRRAGFLTLGIALVFVFIILFMEHRRVFWVITPPLILIGMVYMAVFWNHSGALGMPANAFKSVFFAEQASERDLSSNLYRVAENLNLTFTIDQTPLTGIGFGQKYYVIIPMADISFFSWWQYLPHNSIMWVWLKTGVFGFIAFLYLIGFSLQLSATTLMRLPRNELSAVVLSGSLYIMMHFAFAYVDISWDARSMVYLGSIMGIINALPKIMTDPLPAKKRRWPWQPEPQPEPALLPIAEK